jgi:hypothetical protein
VKIGVKQVKTIEYATLDKSKWGNGPWQNEPDKKQWLDETTGYPCMIRRGPSGAWCGYVGIDKNHKWFEAPYSHCDVEDTVDVHGGVTFAGKCMVEMGTETGICHVVEENEDDNIWWFGFDCAHGMDYMPALRSEILEVRQHLEQTNAKEALEALSQAANYVEDPLGFGETYKNIEYVTQQTLNLAQQLRSAA